jgi:hypothetical protein
MIRRRRVLVVSVGALALLLAAAAATGVGPWKSSPLAPTRWVGFNDISIGYRLVGAQQDAALSARAGAGVSRISLDWRWIEPERGRFRWAPYDALVSALRARGIRPLLAILFAPHWAWAPGVACDQYRQDCSYPPGPAHDADWRAFVESAVRRYPDAVAVEVWNEPNLSGFWTPRPDPARYAELLHGAASAVRRAAPSLPVLLGGLAPVESPSGTAVPAGAFLSAVYAGGGRGTFAGIGVHLYPCSPGRPDVATGLAQVRASRDGAGDASPLWVTELGVSTTGRPPCARHPEAEQAQMLADAYAQLRGAPDVRAVIVHTLIDRPGPASDRESGFGVVRRDLSPKRAFCVLASSGNCSAGAGG